MGVTGLWRLLQPCGQPVHTESLQNKTVAVDVSIWLNQAMKGYRDSNGQPLPNAHLLCVFHRVCKLLAYRVRPVFVFDGGVPSLKYHTLNERRLRKQTASGAAQRTNTALVQNLIRQYALRTVLGEEEPTRIRSTGASQSTDMFQLPSASCEENENGESTGDEADVSSTCSSDSEADAIVNRLGTNLHDFDFDAAEFQSLPSQIKHDILSELKDTRKQSSWGKMHEMPDESGSFSNYQMDRLLKRKKFQDTMDKVEADITKRNTELLHLGIGLSESLSVRRMASKADTYLVLGQLSSPNKKTQSQSGSSHEADLKSVKDSTPSDVSDKTIDLELKPIDKPVEVSGTDDKSNKSVIINRKGCEISPVEIDGKATKSTVKDDGESLEKNSVKYAEGVKAVVRSMETVCPVVESTGGSASVHISIGLFNSLESRELSNEKLRNKSGDMTLNIDPGLSSKDDLFDDIFIDNAAEKASSNPPSLGNIRNFIGFEKGPDFNNSSIEGVMSNSDSISETEDQVDFQDNISTVDPTDNISSPTTINNEKSVSSDSESEIAFGQTEGKVERIQRSDDEQLPDDIVDREEIECKLGEKSASEYADKLGVIVKINPTPDESNSVSVVENVEYPISETLSPGEIVSVNVDERTVMNRSGVISNINPTPDESNSVSIVENVEHPISEPLSLEEVVPVNADDRKDMNRSADGESDASLEDELLLKQGLTNDQIRDLASDLSGEQTELLKERGRQNRLAASVSEQMYSDIKSMLQLFGIPYVVAPMEAEAQCAFLESVGLTDGTITDDSDVWLFGGRLVYKNFFNQNRHVEKYRAEDIERLLGVGREHLICVALLTGSDYTTGVDGVGCVRALEILAEFPGHGLDSLRSFKQWWKSVHENQSRAALSSLRRNLAELQLGDAFPSEFIAKAYLEPEVDTDREPFSWAQPDFDGLRQMAFKKMGWSIVQTDSILQPVIKRMNSSSVQTNLLQFFNTAVKEVSPRKQSQRLKRVTDKIRFGEDAPAVSTEFYSKKATKSSNKRMNHKKTTRGDDAIDPFWSDDGLDEELGKIKEDGSVCVNLVDSIGISGQYSTEAIGTTSYKLNTFNQSNTASADSYSFRAETVENSNGPSIVSQSGNCATDEIDSGETNIGGSSSSARELPNHISDEQLRRINITRDMRLRAQRIKTSLQTTADLDSPQPFQRRISTRRVRNQMYQQLLKSNPRLRAERLMNVVQNSIASANRESQNGASGSISNCLDSTKKTRKKRSRTKQNVSTSSIAVLPRNSQSEPNTSNRSDTHHVTPQSTAIGTYEQNVDVPVISAVLRSDIIPQLEADKRRQDEAKRKAVQILSSRRPGQRKRVKAASTSNTRLAANLSDEDSDS